jgi:hypothetical protein
MRCEMGPRSGFGMIYGVGTTLEDFFSGHVLYCMLWGDFSRFVRYEMRDGSKVRFCQDL